MYAGNKIQFGERELIVPPLSIAQLREHREGLEKLQAGANTNNMQLCAPIIGAALSRNYPTITIEEVEALVDLGNVGPVMAAVCGIGPADPPAR